MNNKNLIIAISVLLLLSACSQNARNKLGLSTTGPDEYQVKRSAHLEVPPHYKAKPVTTKNESKEANNKISKSESALLKELNQTK